MPQKFKDTTLFDWDAEPSESRGDSFFLSEGRDSRTRRRKRSETRLAVWFAVAAVTLAAGMMAILEFARILRTGHF